VVELPVIGFNRGGLLVEARSLRGFVPVSHLLDFEGGVPEQDRQGRLAAYVGSRLCLKVIEHDTGRGRLVLSQRAAQSGPGQRLSLLTSLLPGDVVSGIVTNITRFGVFVDLGGVEGLIHVSELSWGRVRHPQDVVACGQQLRVKVLSVERQHCRVALSLKELLPDPWQKIAEQHAVGDLVEGVITNVVRFGAFVGLPEGLEGLIHISELGEGSLLHPRNAVREGERVRARIIHLDPASRRLGLSLRQVQPGSEGSSAVPP
jgi:small subunit ribosomal protein S1